MTFYERNLPKSIIDITDVEDFIELCLFDRKNAFSFLSKYIDYVTSNYKRKFTSKELQFAFTLPTVDIIGLWIYRGMFVLSQFIDRFDYEEIPLKYYQEGQFSSWTQNKKVAEYFSSNEAETSYAKSSVSGEPILLKTRVTSKSFYISPEFLNLLLIKTFYILDDRLSNLSYIQQKDEKEYPLYDFLLMNIKDLEYTKGFNEEELFLFADADQIVIEDEEY